MATLDQITYFLADKSVTPFSYVGTIVYTQLDNGWVAPYSGFLVVAIEPSNTSVAYANIQDLTDDINDVCKLYSQNQATNCVMMPVIKGHEYKLRTKTNNIQADNRCYGRYYKFF